MKKMIAVTLIVFCVMIGMRAFAQPWSIRVFAVDRGGRALTGARVFLYHIEAGKRKGEECKLSVCKFSEAGRYTIQMQAPSYTTVTRDEFLEGRSHLIVLQTQPHFAIDPSPLGTGQISVTVGSSSPSPQGLHWIKITSAQSYVNWEGEVTGNSVISPPLPSGVYFVIEFDGGLIRRCAIAKHSELEATSVMLPAKGTCPVLSQ
jgi:hypothetical protein